ncbi:MAG: hypothetical protein JNJ57_06195 [Saprospiraceae bacterium]|nr:hypothetical protein [Saprospiraceae bacterium]
MNFKSFIATTAILVLFGCNPDSPTLPPATFELAINNEYNELNGRFAIFITRPEDGSVLAFQWLPGEETSQVQVPDSKETDLFDCTIVKVSTLIAPGTGVRDTFLNLTTYTQVSSGTQISLRDQVYQKATDLTFKLEGMNSLDSVVVPDAYAIQRPYPSNNYSAEYRCYHTGDIWLRILINGDKFWKYVRFSNVTDDNLEANTLDVNLLTSILATPIRINFPFAAEWQYQADGIVDTAKLQFFPLSRQLLPPGSFIPDIAFTEIFEPVNNEQFEPNRPYSGFRLKTKGVGLGPDAYTYLSDNFYNTLPSDLPVPNFDLYPTVLSDNRLIAVDCAGEFDVLAFSRSRAGTLNINWEVLTKPSLGIVSYRLPDVPKTLGDLYLPLKTYDFGGVVRARAESYQKQLSFEDIIRNHLNASDVLWQAKAGYLGREETF